MPFYRFQCPERFSKIYNGNIVATLGIQLLYKMLQTPSEGGETSAIRVCDTLRFIQTIRKQAVYGIQVARRVPFIVFAMLRLQHTKYPPIK